MQGKDPCDDKLKERGCNHSFIIAEESSFHLFFLHPYAIKLWHWFASVLNVTLQFNSFDDICKLCEKGWSQQCKLVIQAALVNILFSI